MLTKILSNIAFVIPASCLIIGVIWFVLLRIGKNDTFGNDNKEKK